MPVALKVLVLVLGLLILLVGGLMVWRIATLMDNPESAPPPVSGVAPLTAFEAASVPLPPGAVVQGHAMDGAVLSVRVRVDGQTRIVVYDVSAGRMLGTVVLEDGGL